VLAVYAGLIGFLGILLGSLARSEGQAVGIGVLASNVLAALGGCWWPIEITPGWMQHLALFLPTGWAMDALHRLVNFGASPASVLPHVAVMAGAAAVAAALSARVFRFQ
jgi:ABC-type multidrug transport system permease subunit